MPRYALIYRNGTPPQSPEEGQKHMEAWRAWSAGLGDAMVEPGMPFSKAVSLSSDGVSEDVGNQSFDGVSIIEAENFEQAQKMAAGCPHIDLGGDLIVAEGMDLEM